MKASICWAASFLLASASVATAQIVGILPDSAVRRFYSEHASEYAAEGRTMLSAGPRVSRSGGVLSLHLQNGTTVSYTDTLAEGDSHHRFLYVRYYPAPHLHVVHHWFYEGGFFIAIHDETGQQEVVPGSPLLAPDARHFVSASFDLEAGYDPNRIEVWSVAPSGLRRQFVLDGGSQWGPESVRWTGPDSIRFVRTSMNQGTAATHHAPMWLVRTGSTWKVRSAAR